MKNWLVALLLFLPGFLKASGNCSPSGDQVTYGTNNTWIGYVYDALNFSSYSGYVNEGAVASPNFDENFGGDYVNYPTNGCPVYTETFSVRYKLTKNFANGSYQFTVGGDDGYRLSLDGGATWVINKWSDQSYNTTTYVINLSGTYNLVLEYYENSGQNRISFNLQTACLGLENQSVCGTGNVWNAYVYGGTNFGVYEGLMHEGNAANPNFDENFGGDYVNFNTSSCSVYTENFSVRYRLTKSIANGTVVITVGGDDGYRFSLDGGATWVINKWTDQSYNTSTYTATLNGTYNMVLEYYENSGQNRVSFSITGAVLPVHLLSFDAQAQLHTISLQWLVAQETNTAAYEIQRSSNGIDFTPIHQVTATSRLAPAAGKSYEAVDAAPLPGVNYYRLRIIDRDGNYEFSPIARASFSSPLSLQVYPTLVAGNEVTIRVFKPLIQLYASLYDITGKKISETLVTARASAGQLLILPVRQNGLTRGTYILQLHAGPELVSTQKICLQ